MNGAVVQIPGHDAPAGAVFVHDKVKREVFDVEFRIVFQRLLIQGVQHGVAGTIGGGAGALRLRSLAVLGRHAAKRALVNFTFRRAAERNAVMFQLDNCRHRFSAHIFNGILIAQPV